MPGRAQRKPSKDKEHGIDPADGGFLSLGRPLVSPGLAGFMAGQSRPAHGAPTLIPRDAILDGPLKVRAR